MSCCDDDRVGIDQVPARKLAEQRIVHELVDIRARAAVEGVGSHVVGLHPDNPHTLQAEDVDPGAAQEDIVVIVPDEGVIELGPDHVLDAVQDVVVRITGPRCPGSEG